jgi:DnaD/phage-associated family protein
MLDLTLTRTAAAMEYWLDAGVIAEETHTYLVDPDLPRGSAAEDAAVIREEDLAACIEACGQILGKLLNPSEIGTLVAILRELSVSEAYLVSLLNYCVNTLDKKGVKYAEKVAISLCERGITTAEALEEYIKRQEQVHSVEGQIRRLFGMGARMLTDKEREILDRWVNIYGYDMDIIAIAYDITTALADKVSIRYADKIIAAWHQQGLKTVAEIEAFVESERKSRKASHTKKPAAKGKSEATSFDVNAFFEDALSRSYNTDKKGN